MDDTKILTVLISGLVSIIISMATYFGLLRNLKESQFQAIIKERVLAYSSLWAILIKYGNIYYYHNLKYDENWVINYHNELDDCNIKYGVLFSKDVHRYFEKLREGLQLIRNELLQNPNYINESNFQDQCKNLYAIIDDKDKNRKGLGGLLKRGLGSFRKPIIE